MPTKAPADSAQLARKAAVIDDIKTRLDGADAAVLTEYRGITVAQIAELRAALRPAGTDYKIFKNTLAKRAAKEVGLKYNLDIWAGIFAPKGVPKEVVGKLAAALDKALDDPVVAKRLADLGASIPAKTERNPASFGRLVKAEIAHWSPVLKAAAASSN